MRNMNALVAHPVFQLLGWTLLHFIWQGALVALGYACISITLRHRSTANVRYTIACACLALMLALPVATFFHLNSAASAVAADRGSSNVSPDEPANASGMAATRLHEGGMFPPRLINAPGEEGASAPFERWAVARFTSALPWLVLVWLAGALVLLLRLVGSWVLT
ncbi:MAG: hypothetical protein LC747_04430, partial [Acidobacteria bacterium]|nr:hypothetical protein [Acidobacteriota bacterium]